MMAELIGLWLYLHEKNLPLYALVTVFSVGLAGLAASGVATGLLTVVESMRGRFKGDGDK